MLKVNNKETSVSKFNFEHVVTGWEDVPLKFVEGSLLNNYCLHFKSKNKIKIN